jgi:predicted enzyme related to lactoylglutathione lyase
MGLLIDIDVPDLAAAIAFYTGAFGLIVTRRLGPEAAELGGWPPPLYLLQKPAGSIAAAAERRRYERHWTVHLDVVVDDLDTALARAVSAGARAETDIRTESWGTIVGLTDPFGHGLCLIQFLGRGYDEIAAPGTDAAMRSN